MPGIIWSTLHVLSPLILIPPPQIDHSKISILRMRKMRHREITEPFQAHTATKQQSQDVNLCS